MIFLENTQVDELGKMLGTNYLRFSCACGIDGLAKERGTMLDILAVHARKTGTGQFREFIRLAREKFDSIVIWHVDNPDLREALTRYGFRDVEERQCFGGQWETTPGMRWDK